jgi:TIR domain
MAEQIFFSFPASETDWVQSFTEALKRRGVRVCMDHATADEESYEAVLRKGLETSDVMVAMIDADSLKRPYRVVEYTAAMMTEKPLVVILADDTDPKKIPFSFEIDRFLVKASPEETANELTHTLAAA